MISRRDALKIGAAGLVGPEIMSVTNSHYQPALIDNLSDVPAFRGGSARTGQMHGPGPDLDLPLVIKWHFDASNDSRPSPIISGDKVFVTQFSRWGYRPTPENGLFALDLHSGNERWNYTVSINDPIFSTPVVDSESLFAVIGYDLISFNKSTGEIQWSLPVPFGLSGGSSPALGNGMLLIGGSHLFAFDPVDGREIWSFETGNSVTASPAISGDTVFITERSGPLYAVSLHDGKEQWRVDFYDYQGSTPAISNGIVYVGNDGVRDWRKRGVTAFEAESGGELWHFLTHSSVHSSPAVDDNSVYFGTESGDIYSVAAETGEIQWALDFRELESVSAVSSSFAIVGSVLYVGIVGKNFYVLDCKTGEILSTLTLPGWGISSPAVSNGMIFVGTREEGFYAIGN